MTVGEALGFACMEADSGESALALLEEQPANIILTDMVMANMSGLEFLEQVKKLFPRTEVAVMTGHGSVESAVHAMKLVAYDYISKPFSPLEELRLFLRRMAEKIRLVEENQFLRERTETETELHGIVGASAKIQDVLRMISRLKDTRTPVLITGESGTGKELVARAIHFRGSFANSPFVAVDCGSLVPWFLDRYAPGKPVQVTNSAIKCLLQYDWPGNVRELENCIERAIALGDHQVIDVGDLPPALASALPGMEPPGAVPVFTTTDLEDIEKATIQRVFEQVKGDKAMARKMLGISRATLYRKLKRYNIGTQAAASAALQ